MVRQLQTLCFPLIVSRDQLTELDPLLCRCFICQCPIAALSLVLIIWRLPRHTGHTAGAGSESHWDKFARIDFAGFLIIPTALIAAFLALDFAGKFYPWQYVVPLSGIAVVLFIVFYLVEKYYAKEPIIPIELITRSDVYIPYLLIALQTAAQFIVSVTLQPYAHSILTFTMPS